MSYENMKEENTNYVKIVGLVVDEPTKSHEVCGENFFEFKVEVDRLSSNKDILPVTVSERIMSGVKVGDFVEIVGEYRSFNKLQNEKSRLILTVFAKDLKVLSEKEEFFNEIKLTGFICKEPIYRKTPFEREICDILIAVNRTNYHKSDYIPCILWGRNARFVANQHIGCKVELSGRIQSREYNKTLPSGETETKTAYEVSCQSVTILGNVAKFDVKQTENKTKVVND